MSNLQPHSRAVKGNTVLPTACRMSCRHDHQTFARTVLQAHIPYRNQKLTMLMSDSLGGSAKTLMFVNVSPTDSNLDETQTSLAVRLLLTTVSCMHLL